MGVSSLSLEGRLLFHVYDAGLINYSSMQACFKPTPFVILNETVFT